LEEAVIDTPLTEHIATAWGRWFPGRRGDRLRFGFVARSNANLRRGVVFVFEPGQRSPTAVVKVSLDERGDVGLRAEHAATAALHRASVPGPQAPPVRLPAPLALEHVGDTTLAAFTAVPGALLLPADLDSERQLLARRSLRKHLEAARTVGEVLATVELPPDAPPTVSLTAIVDDVVRLTAPGGDLADRLASFRRAVDGSVADVPARWQHGDLAHGNLLFDRGTVGAVDLELASPARPVWFDEAYAVLSLAFMHTPAVEAERFAHRFDRARWPSSAIGASVGDGWPHGLPAPWALALTAMICTVRSHELERGEVERWRSLLTVLLGADPETTDRCPHLVAAW
jgi:hypothetical protein